ncbi:MAG: hypothetical protein DMG07_02570 [Acidobacteria bacterium]|nr:MAG: hypothetical protein DMG07_02570 [Acidobacteriota bacterium]
MSPDLLVRNIKTLEDQINGTLFEERLIARLLGFFGLLALVLACVGLYGVMSHDVARRTREIGIRLALGAGYRDTLGAVLRETLLVAGIGVALGGPAALAAARLLERLLFGLARLPTRSPWRRPRWPCWRWWRRWPAISPPAAPPASIPWWPCAMSDLSA